MRTYALHSEVSAPEEAGAPTDRFSAVLSLRVVDAQPDRSTLRAGLSQVELQQQLSDPEDRVSHSLEAGFELDVGRDCRIQALRLPAAWSASAGLMVSGLLSLHEHVLQPGASWEADQTDGVGRHRARYLRSGDEVQRRKLYYDSQGLEAFGMSVSLPMAEASARFDARGLISSTVHERLRITVGDELRADLEQRSTLVRDTDDRFAEPRASDALARYDPGASAKGVRLPEAPADPAALARAYQTLAGRLSDWTVRDARTMAGLLVARPELVAELRALLDRQALDETGRASVFWALELAGTKTAKRALLSLLSAPRDHDRVRAASALASAGNAVVADGEALLSLYRQDDEPRVSSAALLALGAMGVEASPEVKSYVRDQLEAELLAADGPEATRVALQAIGNTGDPELLGLAAERLGDAEPAVRATAASALRRMGRPAVAPLKRAFESETSAAVAAAMARALIELGAPSEEDVVWAGQKLAQTSDASAVRKGLIEWLGASDSAQARAALAAHFHAEPSSQLRQVIGRYVTVAELKR
ncbi:MAG: HEAT repeat domain-containing protein [Myxococcales bacterium]|nr:HEAT repeat domain-containing protein [Myxococcales bacterium]